MKKYIILFIVVMLFSTSNVYAFSFFSSIEDQVKEAPFPLDPSAKTKDILEGYSYFRKETCKWKNFKTNQGRTIVQFDACYIIQDEDLKWLIAKSGIKKFWKDEQKDVNRDINITIQFLIYGNEHFSVEYIGCHRDGVELKIDKEKLISKIINNEKFGTLSVLEYVWEQDESIREKHEIIFKQEMEKENERLTKRYKNFLAKNDVENKKYIYIENRDYHEPCSKYVYIYITETYDNQKGWMPSKYYFYNMEYDNKLNIYKIDYSEKMLTLQELEFDHKNDPMQWISFSIGEYKLNYKNGKKEFINSYGKSVDFLLITDKNINNKTQINNLTISDLLYPDKVKQENEKFIKELQEKYNKEQYELKMKQEEKRKQQEEEKRRQQEEEKRRQQEERRKVQEILNMEKLKKEEKLKKDKEKKIIIEKLSKQISGNYLNDKKSECITFDINFNYLEIDKQKQHSFIKNKIFFKRYYYQAFKIQDINIKRSNNFDEVEIYLSGDTYNKITFLIYKDHIECFSDGKIDEKQTGYGKIKYAFKNFIKSSENDKLIY